MSDYTIQMSDGEKSVALPGAKVIGVSASAQTERSRGYSTIRFLLEGDEAMGNEPFATLSSWDFDETPVILEVANLPKVEGCSFRECSLDMWARRLYVQIYTPFRAQEVQHWFA